MLESKQKQVLADLLVVADSLELPMLVVGAYSRILVFDNRYNVEGRATTDLDLAVRVDSWSAYQALTAEMQKGINPRFRATNISHKFIHVNTETEVDIVPFGQIGEPNQEIEWSDGTQMSLLGLEEALVYAEVLSIDEIEIKVVTIPAFIALKLIAWQERLARKDLEDINLILERYEDERIFAELADELSSGEIDFNAAAAFLLGRDIRNMFGNNTLTELDQILSQIQENRDNIIPQLLPRIFDSDEWDATFDSTVQRFTALQKGINLPRSQ